VVLSCQKVILETYFFQFRDPIEKQNRSSTYLKITNV